MKTKVLALSIIIVLAISLTSISLVHGASTSSAKWITSYTVYDSQTDQRLVTYDSETNETTRLGAVVPGAEIRITFTVSIVVVGDGDLKLTSGLNKPSSGPIWELSEDSDYELGSSFSPNKASTALSWSEGEFEMTCYGIVPSSGASTASKIITAVTLAGPSKTLDTIKITATSGEMDNFLTLLEDRQDALDELEASGVDAGYIEIYSNVLSTAQDVADGGDVENAIALLEGLDVDNPPASSTMQMLFLPLIAVTAVIAVIFVVLFFRIRGKVSYMSLVVEDQIKDLEGISLRASKIDRSMSSNLESVKERLRQIVGM